MIMIMIRKMIRVRTMIMIRIRIMPPGDHRDHGNITILVQYLLLLDHPLARINSKNSQPSQHVRDPVKNVLADFVR